MYMPPEHKDWSLESQRLGGGFLKRRVIFTRTKSEQSQSWNRYPPLSPLISRQGSLEEYAKHPSNLQTGDNGTCVSIRPLSKFLNVILAPSSGLDLTQPNQKANTYAITYRRKAKNDGQERVDQLVTNQRQTFYPHFT